MKNSITFSVLFFAVIFVFSCKPDCPDVINENTLTTEDTISLQTFNTWKTNWDSLGRSYTDNTLTRYFTMPLIDITEFDENKSDSIVAARFYLGIELNGTDTIPHLMLTGVNSRGEAVIDEAEKQYIYDVTKPCPSSCGSNSLPNK